MFDFLKKKEASPASAAASPDDPTVKWLARIDDLQHQHAALKSLLNQGGGNGNVSPSRKLNDGTAAASPEKNNNSSSSSPDAAGGADADDENQPEDPQLSNLKALRVLCQNEITPQLEQSVTRLREQAENIAKAFHTCRELKAECQGLHRKNEGLTVEAETARLTVIELMEKIKKISPTAAAAAKQQQSDLKSQLEVQIREQRHTAELERLKRENAKLSSERNSIMSSSSALNSPSSSTSQLARGAETPPEMTPSKNSSSGNYVVDNDANSSSLRQQQQLEAEQDALRQKLREQGQSLEQQRLQAEERFRDREAALARERDLAEQNAKSLQQHIDDLRQEVADLKQQIAEEKSDFDKRERDLHEELRREREVVARQSFISAAHALQSEEGSVRAGGVVADEADSRRDEIEIPFLQSLLVMMASLRRSNESLQTDLTENTRALMKIQSASPSPAASPEKSKSRFGF